MHTASSWIEHLKLDPGGYNGETYRTAETLTREALPERVREIFQFHKAKSDELWHFPAGASLLIYIHHADHVSFRKFDVNIEDGDQPQIVILAKCWFRVVAQRDAYTVWPGFGLQDFEMAKPSQLLTLSS